MVGESSIDAEAISSLDAGVPIQSPPSLSLPSN